MDERIDKAPRAVKASLPAVYSVIEEWLEKQYWICVEVLIDAKKGEDFRYFQGKAATYRELLKWWRKKK